MKKGLCEEHIPSGHMECLFSGGSRGNVLVLSLWGRMVISLLSNDIQYGLQLTGINLQLQKTQKPFRLPVKGKNGAYLQY